MRIRNSSGVQNDRRWRPPEDFDVQLAVQTLRMLTIELLRAIACGNDPEHRIAGQLTELYKLLGNAGVTVATVDPKPEKNEGD